LHIPHTYKFESENVAELQDAMISLIALTEAQKEKIVSDQKDYVVKNFDLDQWARKISSIYKDLGKPDRQYNDAMGDSRLETA